MKIIRVFSMCVVLVLVGACSDGGGNGGQDVVELPINVTSVLLEGDFSLNGVAFYAHRSAGHVLKPPGDSPVNCLRPALWEPGFFPDFHKYMGDTGIIAEGIAFFARRFSIFKDSFQNPSGIWVRLLLDCTAIGTQLIITKCRTGFHQTGFNGIFYFFSI